MHRIDGVTAAVALPAPGAVVGTPGFFTDGDPLTSTPPTTMSFDWANSIQEEIAYVIEQAGGTLDKANNHQLLAAILTVAGGAVGSGLTFTTNSNGSAIGINIGGTFRYIQFGSITVGNQTTATITYPVGLTTIGVCVGSGGPNANDDSDARVVSSGTTTATVRNADGSSCTFFWICVGF